MAVLPSAGSESVVGVLITTRAEDGAIKTTQAELTVLGDTAKKSAAQATSLSSNFKKLGTNLTTIGRDLTTFVTLPIVGIGFAASKMASDFQTQMALVRTQAGDTTDNIAQLSQQVLNLARTSQFSPTELAQGLYFVASFGYRGADAMKNLKAMTDLATIGQANLADTSRAVNAVMATGINGTQNLQETIGTLNAIVGVGAMRMNDLVAAMGTGFVEQAKVAGLSLGDVGAALATMTDTGMSAEAAATRIRMALGFIENPSKKAQGSLAAIGLTSTSLAEDMRSKGIIFALQDLQKRLVDVYGTTDEGKNKIAQALGDMFGGARSGVAVETLLDQLSRIQQKSLATAAAGTQVADALKTMESTPGFQMKESWSKIQVALIELGDHILPIVVPLIGRFADTVSRIADGFSRLSPMQKNWVLGLAAVAALAGPILMVVGGIASAIGAIAALGAPFLIVIGAIAGLAVLAGVIITNWKPISGFFGNLFSAIKSGADDLKKHFFERLGEVAGLMATFPFVWPKYVVEAVADMVDVIRTNNWGKTFQPIHDALVKSFKDALADIAHIDWGSAVKNYAGSVLGAEGSFLKGILKGAGANLPPFASGTNYAPGGWSIVGEHGPEAMYVPQGTMIKTAPQTSSLGNSSGGISLYQTNNNYSNFDLTQANRQLAWQLSNAIG